MRYFLLIYFLCIPFVNAQKLNETEYENAVDFVTCVCMNVVLKNQDNDCKTTRLELKDIPKDQTASIALFQEFQSLKKEKNKNVDFLVNEIFTNEKKFQKIYAFAKKYSTQLNGIKLDIESDIKNFSSVNKNQEELNNPSDTIDSHLTAQDVPQEEPQIEPITEVTNVKTKETIMETSYIEQNFLTLIIGIILIILIVCVIFKNNASKKELEDIRKKIRNRQEANSSNTETIKNYDSIRLEREIDLISKKIIELEDNFKILNQKSMEQPVTVPMPMVKQEPISDTFYMAAPNGDGTFDINGNTSKEVALYEFIVDLKNPLKAEFSFIASDTKIIQSVVDYSQTYINPACDAQNALNQNAKRIITLYPGTAERRNDKWIIITKAQIKYE